MARNASQDDTGRAPLDTLPETTTRETSHTGRNVAIAVASVALAAGAGAGIYAASANNQPRPQEQATDNNEDQAAGTPSSFASPSNTQALESAPATAPAKIEPAKGVASEFGITDAEYQQLVQSYAIDADKYTTPEQVTAAYVARINAYYSAETTRKSITDHASYAAPDGQHFGWNAWATNLHTKAMMDGLFAPRAQDDPAVRAQYASNATEFRRMWANSVKANEPEYKVALSVVPTDTQATPTSIVVTGTETIRDNSAQVPSAASDSHKIGEMSYPNSKITFVLDAPQHQWRVLSDK